MASHAARRGAGETQGDPPDAGGTRADRAGANGTHVDRLAAGGSGGEPHDAAELGSAVRAQRERRGMTIASLARKVGVSAAAISQIESGAVQPSIATLRKLAASLKIPVFRLFLPVESEAVKVVRHADRMTIGRPQSGARYQLLSPSLHGQLEVMEVSMDPGLDSAPELLSHGGEECLIVISGRGALELSDAVIDLRAGDAATFQGSIPHRLRNVGRNRLTALSIITPPSF
jgi:transcriptional regulator with XRE-family HTH domain